VILRNKTLIYLLSISNVIGLFYLFVLAYYFIPTTGDDISTLNRFDTSGIFDYVREIYFTWSGRYAALFFNGVVYRIYILTGSFPLILSFITLFGISSFYFFLNLVISNQSSFYFKLNLSAFLYIVFILAAFDFSSLFWLCTIGYFMLMFVFLFGIYFLFRAKSNPLNYLGLFICFAYMGGGGEQLAPLVIFTLLISFFYLHFTSQYNSLVILKRKILFSFFVCLIAFIILFIAPGNFNRLNVNNHQPQLLMYIPLLLKAIALLLVHFIFKIHFYLVLVPVFILLGTSELLKFTISKKAMIMISIAFITSIVVGIFPAIYAFGRLYDTRALTFIEMIIMCYICLVSYFIGNLNIISRASIKIVSMAVFVLFDVFILTKLFVEFPLIRDFKASVVNRERLFIQLNSKIPNDSIIELEPLKHPLYRTWHSSLRAKIYRLGTKKTKDQGYISPYFTEDISFDILLNTEVKKYYGLNFNIKLKAQPTKPIFKIFRNPNVE